MKTLLVSSPAIVGSRCLFSIVTFVAIGSAEAQNRVLFIGNSFTLGWSDEMAQMVGGVPAIFDALARAGGHHDPATEMRALAGVNFEFHATDLATQNAITSQQWTHVVLQNRSADPTHLTKGSIEDHHKFGAQLYDQITANNAPAQVILYETFSRADAHWLITGVSGPNSFASTAEFQDEIRTNYATLAAGLTAANEDRHPVQVAPVGTAWERAGALLSDDAEGFVCLHSSDEYHGNDSGYYLTAAVIYATIYGKSPEGLSVSPEVQVLNLALSEKVAMLERVAWETVVARMPVVVGQVVLGVERGSRFEITTIEYRAGSITLTWASGVDAIYSIESSRDLEIWEQLQEGIASGGRTTACTVESSKDALVSYYRVNSE